MNVSFDLGCRSVIFHLGVFVKANAAKHIIPATIAREVKITIIFPPIDSDEAALDREGASAFYHIPHGDVCIAF